MKIRKNALSKFLIVGMLILSCTKNDDPTISLTNKPLTSFAKVIQDEFEGEKIVVYANSDLNIMVAYCRKQLDGTTLNFEPSGFGFPNIFKDNEGNIWNIYGEAVSGIRKGSQLKNLNYTVGYWFSFADFFPKVMLYGKEMTERIEIKNTPNWLVDSNNIFQASSQDGIPSIDNPIYYEELTKKMDDPQFFLKDDDLVITVENGNNLYVYPHKILDWHEIVNATINSESVLISFCPLTGTTLVFKSTINGKDFEYGTSGLLYKNNLILFDRSTESLWSQILGQSIFGILKGTKPNKINSPEMTWEAAKLTGKKIKLLSVNTGHTRDYQKFPYGDYKTNNEYLLFPLSYTDNRVPNKERVLTIIVGQKAKTYRFKDFI